jgi:GGDEF domain-containing protein
LYAIETGESVVFVEGDWGNMGGSNDFFRELISQIDPELAKDPASGFKYTDALAKVTAGIVQEELLNAAEENDGIVVPYRIGGDEIRDVVIGLDKEEAERVLEEKVRPRIEEFIATVDSADHAHIKYRDDKNKNGFGLSCGVAQVGNDETPVYEKIQNAEHDINTNKVIAGANRQGKVSEVEKKKIKSKISYASVLQGEGVARVISGHEFGVKTVHEYWDRLKKQCREQGGALKVLDDIIAGTHPKYGKYFQDSGDKKPEVQVGAESHALFESHTDSVKKQVKSQVPENDVDAAVLDVVTDRFVPIDPPTKLKTPRDFKKDVKYVMDDTTSLRGQGETVQNPYIYEIRFGSLGPINDTLGHQEADEVLHYQAQEILKQTFEKHGLSSVIKSATHKGGASYPAVVPGVKTNDNGVARDNGELIPVTMGDLEAVFAEVKQRCNEELNARTPAEFFEDISNKDGHEKKRAYTIPEEYSKKPFAEFYNSKKDVYGMTVSMAVVELSDGADIDKAMTDLLIKGEAAEKAAIVEAQQKHANAGARDTINTVTTQSIIAARQNGRG